VQFRKLYSAADFVTQYGLIENQARILNAGSASIRYGEHCLNIDIQAKPGVDVVADLHELPASIGLFDAIICNAVLQYCRRPAVVVAQFKKVLKPGGLIFLDAPWVQPYCSDTEDLHRFSEMGLSRLFDQFEIIQSGASITPGSALVMQASFMARDLSSNKYLSFALAKATEFFLYPLGWIKTRRPAHTAGAIYLIARA